MLYRLEAVENRTQLARSLGVPLQLFRRVVNAERTEALYFRHEIPKRNPKFAGESRIAWQARDETLARAHKAVARRLDAYLRSRSICYPHPCAHGYVHGGSTRSNAEPHCGAKFLVRADIASFFPSIPARRVAASLRFAGFKTLPARDLAKFVTIDGALPLGLPESPIISNLVALPLDVELASFASLRFLKYTRYSDDITFSGASRLPTREEVREVLERHNFHLSERKFRFSKRGQAHFVTGLSVAEPDYPHAPKKMKRRLRQELHYCSKFGLESHSERRGELPQKAFNRLYGMVTYISFIERRQSSALREKWTEIAQQSYGSSVFAPGNFKDAREVSLIVDESEFEVSGTRFLALAFVRTEAINAVQDGIRWIRTDYLTNPGAKGNLERLHRTGIHFSDAHFDLRTLAFQALLELPWSASIQFKRIESDADYADAWLELFKGALRQEMSVSDGARVNISVEKNDKISTFRLTEVILSEFSSAEMRNSKRPREAPSMKRISKKGSPEVTLPDFVLGAFRHNAMRSSDDKVLDFERIRDRVRYIRDANSNQFYTRKKPFVDIGVKPK